MTPWSARPRRGAARSATALLGVLLCTVQFAWGESPVDFSGTWKLDKNRSVFPNSAPAVIPGELTMIVDQHGDILKIERRFHVFGIHRLVLQAFIGPCPEGYVTDHLDGIPSNNRPSNLEWVSYGENIRRAYALGLHSPLKGERNPSAKLTPYSNPISPCLLHRFPSLIQKRIALSMRPRSSDLSR